MRKRATRIALAGNTALSIAGGSTVHAQDVCSVVESIKIIAQQDGSGFSFGQDLEIEGDTAVVVAVENVDYPVIIHLTQGTFAPMIRV